MYLFDIGSLLKQGKIEHYKISKTLSGAACQLKAAAQISRLCFLPNFSNIEVLPFFHRNTFNFLGMGIKQDYLIWRESNGFFTAMNRSGILQTWSVCTGKLLYYVTYEDYRNLNNYIVYAANEKDKSNLMNFTQLADHSISLVRRSYPELSSHDKKDAKSKKTQSFGNFGTNSSINPEIQDEGKDKIFQTDSKSIELTEIQTGCSMDIFNFKVLQLKSAFDFYPYYIEK